MENYFSKNKEDVGICQIKKAEYFDNDLVLNKLSEITINQPLHIKKKTLHVVIQDCVNSQVVIFLAMIRFLITLQLQLNGVLFLSRAVKFKLMKIITVSKCCQFIPHSLK